MKIGAMVGDVFHSLFRRPATRQYPFERKEAPQRLRGKLHWDPQKCTGCLLCVKDCPADALEVFMVDKENKRFALRYHVDRCTFCSQCVVSCRPGALELLSEEWELAATSKESFTVYFGDEADVRRLVELAQAGANGAEDS
jgi:NAD(P)H-quinone oxidoreductase subunit I